MRTEEVAEDALHGITVYQYQRILESAYHGDHRHNVRRGREV